jgi:hypothetical protein
MVRLALVILSSPTEPSRQRRCWQRATFLALARPESVRNARPGEWLQLVGGGSVLWRYVVSNAASGSSKSLQRELAMHGDVLLSNLTEKPGTCFEKLVAGLSFVASGRASPSASTRLDPPDFLGVSDDDAWLSPPRLLEDLTPLHAALPRDEDLLYGTT